MVPLLPSPTPPHEDKFQVLSVYLLKLPELDYHFLRSGHGHFSPRAAEMIYLNSPTPHSTTFSSLYTPLHRCFKDSTNHVTLVLGSLQCLPIVLRTLSNSLKLETSSSVTWLLPTSPVSSYPTLSLSLNDPATLAFFPPEIGMLSFTFESSTWGSLSTTHHQPPPDSSNVTSLGKPPGPP